MPHVLDPGSRGIIPNGSYEIQVTRSSPNFHAHTCTLVLEIPEISNGEEMMRRLVSNITESGSYFGSV